MEGYGWTMYDTRVGGSQTMHDKELHVDLTTDFVKTEDGESWAVRVTGAPRLDAPGNLRTAIIFHAAVEGATQGGSKSLACENEAQGLGDTRDAAAACHGDIPALGSFELHVAVDARNKMVRGAAVKSLQVSEEKIWRAKCTTPDRSTSMSPM